jgi:tetratricopeptide (TPR) repeat protein
MKTTSQIRHSLSRLTVDQEALLKCETALGLKDQANAEGARRAMRPIWRRMGERPETKGLHPAVAAEVLLTVGILTGWLGGRTETKGAQEVAKNLITESIDYYESVGDTKRIGAARSEIAYCYWRDGQLEEARIMLLKALEQLPTPGNTRARALLKLTALESSALRFDTALRILTDNGSLFENVSTTPSKRATILSTQSSSEILPGQNLQNEMTTFKEHSRNMRRPIIIASWRKTMSFVPR